MKKLFNRGLAFIMVLFSAFSAFAQAPAPMPVDEAVRVGVLPNGLTYYIRHNETPKGQADFYIAQKVGSILEEDNQRGLAHFLEHMCFNGTENFPEKGIINWLESIGVKFGYNLNAYTSIDETVYNISAVPVARQSVQDSCLLILHDWACALTLDPEEIEAERGVIHEEWRRSMAGQMRIFEEQLPVIYPDSRYGLRLPIGTMEVVDNFPAQALIDYYHTWYRPDQQGIVVVGDIDVDYIEGKIKEIFSHIEMPANAKERVYLPVADTPGTIYAIGKDPEQQMAMGMMMFKFDNLIPREMRNTQVYYGVKYLTDIVQSMLNTRLSELSQKPDSPFAHASVEIGDFFVAKTKSALTLTVIGKGNDIRPAMAAAYRELLRAVRGGFTQTEFDRANAELRSQMQRLYDSRNNTQNESYSREYVRSFIDNDPIPGIEVDKQMFDMLSQMIPVEQVNQLLPELIKQDNRVVFTALPEVEGFVIPTEEQLAADIAAVEAENIEAYAEEVRTDPLIPQLPAPGSIVSEQVLDKWGATEYTLSNGIKVIVKPTDYKENEIIFDATAKGGLSVLSDDNAATIALLPYVINSNGYGLYTNSDVKKYLMGKQVGLGMNVSVYDRSLSGQSTVADLATLMELIYAHFTSYNITADEFAATQQMLISVLANQETTPEYAHSKLINSVLYESASKQALTSALVAEADCDVANALIKSMMADPTDYTFCFVGNIDMDVFKPLMEQYIANIPTNGEAVKYVINPAVEFACGNETISQTWEMSEPQVWAFYLYNANLPYSAKSKSIVSIIGQIMSKRLLNKVREEMGATYSIGASSSQSRSGEQNAYLQIYFPMKPELSAEVQTAIDEIVNNMTSDVTEAELAAVKEYMLKNIAEQLEDNSAWAGAMTSIRALNGIDTLSDAAAVLNSITVDDVMNTWKEILNQNNRHLIILNPAM